MQLFEEWLVNDTRSPITQFIESELLSELIRNTNNKRLFSCLEELKEVFEFYEILKMTFKMSLALLHHTGTPIQIWCQHCFGYQQTRRTGDYLKSLAKALERKERRLSGTILYEVTRAEKAKSVCKIFTKSWK